MGEGWMSTGVQPVRIDEGVQGQGAKVGEGSPSTHLTHPSTHPPSTRLLNR